jgi:hypothetical protein
VRALLLLAIPGAVLASTGETREARLETLRGILVRSLAQVEERVGRNERIPARDLTNGALLLLATGGSPEKAQDLLNRAFAAQALTGAQAGAIPLEIPAGPNPDEHGVELAMAPLGPLLLEHGAALPAAFRESLRPHLVAGLEAQKRQDFPIPSDTSVFLLRATNLILIGEALKDTATAALGYQELDRFRDYTAGLGIHEYESSHHYAFDLDALGLGARLAARPEGRATFRKLLDYFWADIGANLVGEEALFLGPTSSTYDAAQEGGALDAYLYLEGLHAMPPRYVGLERVALLVNVRPDGYRPPDSSFASRLETRTVVSRFDVEPDADRYAYVTPDFALGSASHDYGPQDSSVVFGFATAKHLPPVSLTAGFFDDPEGLKSGPRARHFHFPMRPTTVQREGSLLVLLDPTPGIPRGQAPEGAFTQLLLPAKADKILLDGVPIAVAQPFTTPARAGSVLLIQEGKSALAVRVLSGEALTGAPAVIKLEADAAGLKKGIVWLTVVHDQSGLKDRRRGRPRSAFLLLARPCPSDAALQGLAREAQGAQVREATDGTRWIVSASVAGHSLDATWDFGQGKALARKVDGKDVTLPSLSVNGRSLAPLLGAHP